MAHHTPEETLEKLRETHAECEQKLILKQDKQEELAQRIKVLKELLDQIKKAYEDYKKQHDSFSTKQEKLVCYYDAISDPSKDIIDRVEAVIYGVSDDIEAKKKAMEDAEKAKEATAGTLEAAKEAVRWAQETFDALKVSATTVAGLLGKLQTRRGEIDQLECELAEKYFLKLEFKKKLDELDSGLNSPEKLLEELNEAWAGLQAAQDALALAHEADAVAKNKLLEADAIYKEAVENWAATIREAVQPPKP